MEIEIKQELKPMQSAGSILQETKKFLEKMQEGQTTGEPSENAAKKCRLCESPRDVGNHCLSCNEGIVMAGRFAEMNLHIPKRYAEATVGVRYDVGKSYLLHGPPGRGKTHTGYALLRLYRHSDPRLTVAAYRWPAVLLGLRRSYSDKGDATPIIEALGIADVAFLDDLGAERITESNRDWVRETLFVILDERYSEMRTTILTTNVPIEALPQYLGERIVSRILEMCAVVEVSGPDRRMA